MSNFVYLANGDFLNINTRNKIEQFTNVTIMTPPMMTDTITTPPMMTDTIMTPEQIRLQQTLAASRTMNFELQNNIQNINEKADKLLIELLKR